MSESQQGLTLIELIISITIAAILMLVSVPSLMTYFQNVKLRSVADAMQAGLQQAKTEAIRRNILVNFVISGTGWNIVLPNQNGGSDTTLTSRPSRSNESSIVVAASANTIGFTGQNQTFPLNSYTIQFTNPSYSACQHQGGEIRCLNLTISASGSVKLCDPALASTDPRAC